MDTGEHIHCDDHIAGLVVVRAEGHRSAAVLIKRSLSLIDTGDGELLIDGFRIPRIR